MASSHDFQAPSGTRDFYPIEAARRRFLTEAWRRASVRHGFEEIDGPHFEHLSLYTVKSGDGIVSELFAFRRDGGERDYALRPEFTPTLARLFASRAGSLPRPTKWFMAGPFFRAEKPQRGRLREFLQWNVDMLGDASPAADAEIIAVCVSFLASLGLTPKDVRVKINHRAALSQWLETRGLDTGKQMEFFKLLDSKGKIPEHDYTARLGALGFTPEQLEVAQRGIIRRTLDVKRRARDGVLVDDPAEALKGDAPAAEVDPEDAIDVTYFAQAVTPLATELHAAGVLEWVDFDLSVVRGLAYYTGMVFEVHEASGGERAIAGGGRYDNLIELFGGPATPAVGFGMGDVVLSLVLQDRGLMPSDDQLFLAAGQRPDVFVISAPSPEAEALVKPTVAKLRAAGIHARHSYKTTKNVGKLLKDAADCRSKVAVIIESATTATVKDMAGGAQEQMPLEAVLAMFKA